MSIFKSLSLLAGTKTAKKTTTSMKDFAPQITSAPRANTRRVSKAVHNPYASSTGKPNARLKSAIQNSANGSPLSRRSTVEQSKANRAAAMGDRAPRTASKKRNTRKKK